jgi:phenylpyruvate tautomerase PptA (4-oxalocrotonate tautomerase family)
MPLLRITHTRNAFSEAQKQQLAEALTHAILIGETGNDTPVGRSVAYVVFQEIDPSASWYVGGKPEHSPPAGGRFLFDVVYPFGAASQAHKTQLHKDINDIVSRVLGVDGSFPNRIGDWVLIHEITHGNWGVSGQTVGIRDVHRLMEGVPERIDYFDPLLAAQRRMLQTFDYPAGSPGEGQ